MVVYLENTPYYFHLLLCFEEAWWFILKNMLIGLNGYDFGLGFF